MNGAIGTITSAKAFWNQDHVWFREREKGWNDMEYMIRNWNNFCWLCGDHILDTHVIILMLSTGSWENILKRLSDTEAGTEGYR